MAMIENKVAKRGKRNDTPALLFCKNLSRQKVIKINTFFGSDAIIGDFQLSNYGLILASFEGIKSSDEELGMNHGITEEYIGDSPIPKFLGKSFNSKLKPVATIVKDPNVGNRTEDKYFTEHECREILRQLTGFHGYKQMQVLSYEIDELLFFYVHVSNVKYQKIGRNVAGIILEMECDSQFAWSNEFHYRFNATPDSNIILFNNSDDLYSYLLPQVTIKATEDISGLSITNVMDNGWETTFTSMSAGETVTMDSQANTVSSSKPGRVISNDFNMHFIRLVPGKNEFKVSHNIQLTFTYRVPRKVGFL